MHRSFFCEVWDEIKALEAQQPEEKTTALAPLALDNVLRTMYGEGEHSDRRKVHDRQMKDELEAMHTYWCGPRRDGDDLYCQFYKERVDLTHKHATQGGAHAHEEL